ncbi:hypothetical protein [Kitasatospora sp. GP82]|nr:hypothetical protein [Kitasatospora sp. GP82]MDH6130354.1 hypothetical protein [Kitasatospora sp. GP82]
MTPRIVASGVTTWAGLVDSSWGHADSTWNPYDSVWGLTQAM